MLLLVRELLFLLGFPFKNSLFWPLRGCQEIERLDNSKRKVSLIIAELWWRKLLLPLIYIRCGFQLPLRSLT